MYKKHGDSNVIILHGGPGGIGGANVLAKELGAIEVLNYKQTIQGQLDEISEVIEALNLKEVSIIGHSWGAWLAYLYAAQHPIKRIILVGCGSFENEHLEKMHQTRLARLTVDEQRQLDKAFKDLSSGQLKDLTILSPLIDKMDAYDQIGHDELEYFDFEGHSLLMDEVRKLRSSGALLEFGKSIQADIYIFHGQDDPHPLEGIRGPFDRAGINYVCHSFSKCGHVPWQERHAKDLFYERLESVLK